MEAERRPDTAACDAAAPTYSVVVPCYNSDVSLPQVVERIAAVFKTQLRESFEIVMVDDGSPDAGTWARLQELAGRYPEVRAIRLARNFGKPGAMLCGYSAARGQWIIAMDDDLQHAPEDVPKLLAAKEHDVVMGVFKARHHTLGQRLGSWLKGKIEQEFLGKPKSLYISPFHVLRRPVVEEVLKIRTPFPHIGSMLLLVTDDFAMIEVEHHPRADGRSDFTYAKRIAVFLNLLVNNTPFLLRLMQRVAVVIFVSSLVWALYLVWHRLFISQTPIPGWTSLSVFVLFLGGLNLLFLGVVGEYLIRIISGVESKPPFVVRETTDEAGDE